MKTKTILLAAVALGLAVSTGFSQGTVSFANNGTTVFVTTNNYTTTGKATSGMGSRIQLLYLPDTGGSAPTAATFSSIGNWELLGGVGTVGSPLAGDFGAYTDTTGNDVAGGGNVWLMAIGWTGSYSSLAAAEAGSPVLTGVSSVWSQGTGNPNASPPITAVSTTGYFSGLVLTPTPEPATIALGGLGAAALLLFRRRK